MYEGSVLKNQLDSYLKSFGFIRVSTRWASSKIPWGDAFYIKKQKSVPLEKYYELLINFLKNLIYTIFLLILIENLIAGNTKKSRL